MTVPKPTTVPRWADGGSNTPTNVVQPPEHGASIPNWAPGPYTIEAPVMNGGSEYIVLAIAGTGTSTTGPTGTGTTIDNPGANQVTWGFVTATPVTKDSGWLPNIQPPAQWFNWLFFWIYQWILWIQDIQDQNFTGTGSGSVGPWTNRHGFTGGDGSTALVTIVAGSTTGAAGLDATGDVGASLVNPGPGVIGRGGAPVSGGLGAPGVQGFGSGNGQGGQFQGGTSGTTSGGDGVYSTGGPSGSGVVGWGGPAPTGGGSPGTGVVGNGANSTTAIGVEGNGGTGGGTGGQFESGGGDGIGAVGIGTGTGAGIAGTSFGTGPGVQGVASASGGAGVLGQTSVNRPGVEGDSTSGASGVYGNNLGTGSGVEGSAVGAGQAGVYGSATGSGGAGVQGVGLSCAGVVGTADPSGTSANGVQGTGAISGHGGSFTGGATGGGVIGVAGGGNSHGVEGQSAGTGAGVKGISTGSGPAVWANDGSVLVDSNPTTVTTDPGAGQIWKDNQNRAWGFLRFSGGLDSYPAWAAGTFVVNDYVQRYGQVYVVTAIAGTGTSSTGPTSTGTTIDNPGADQVTWQWQGIVPPTGLLSGFGMTAQIVGGDVQITLNHTCINGFPSPQVTSSQGTASGVTGSYAITIIGRTSNTITIRGIWIPDTVSGGSISGVVDFSAVTTALDISVNGNH